MNGKTASPEAVLPIWRYFMNFTNRRKAPLVVLIVAALLAMGCSGSGGDDDPGEGSAPAVTANTWTLQQVGGSDFTATSSPIRITFAKAVEATEKGENLNNLIDVMGAAVRGGVLKKDGASWLIPIDVIGAGAATVIVKENIRGIEVASKTVIVFKLDEFAPVTWTVTANGDVQNSTNKLIFTFTGDIVGQFYLTSGMIIITPDPDVADIRERGNALVTGAARLPGDDYRFEVNVNTSNMGWVLVTVDMEGVDTFAQRLWIILGEKDMFKPPEGSGDAEVEPPKGIGEKVPFKWTVLDMDYSGERADEYLGVGSVVGEDLQKVRDAWGRDTHFYDSDPDPNVRGGYGSFLRIYADISTIIPNETGHAKLAIGNLNLNLTGIEQSLAMQNYTIQPTEGVPVGPGVVTMDVPIRFIIPDYVPETDDYLFVNAWSDVKIYAVVLYEIVTPLKIIRPPRWKRDIAMTGTVDRIAGAGAFFTYYDEAASWDAPEGAWIEFYVKGSGSGNWASTGYNWTVGRDGCIALPSSGLITDPDWGRYNKTMMSAIKNSKTIGNLDRNTLNPYSGSAFEKVWLCWDE
jgi:hypothetical protein